jgi:hypothetical protein
MYTTVIEKFTLIVPFLEAAIYATVLTLESSLLNQLQKLNFGGFFPASN